MEWVVSAKPRPLYTRERPGTHCVGDWVGPRARLDECGNSRPPPGFDPRTVHPGASRYTDWAIPAHSIQWVSGIKWGGGREVNHSLLLVSRLRMNGAVPLLPIYAFMAWTGKTTYKAQSSVSGSYFVRHKTVRQILKIFRTYGFCT